MNRYTFYFKQKPTEDELNDAFDAVESADRALIVDSSLSGIWYGLAVSQHAGTPNLTVDVTAGGAYDALGQRLRIPSNLASVDITVDENNISTAVANSGKEKYLAFCLQFARVNTDPRTDGNSDDIDWNNAEGYAFKIVQGSEANTGTAVRPSVPSDYVILADIKRTYLQTQILTANIESTNRRQDLVVKTSTVNLPETTPFSIRRGRLLDTIGDIVDRLNAIPNRIVSSLYTLYASPNISLTLTTGLDVATGLADVALGTLRVGDIVHWQMSWDNLESSNYSPADAGKIPRVKAFITVGVTATQLCATAIPGSFDVPRCPVHQSGTFTVATAGAHTFSTKFASKSQVRTGGSNADGDVRFSAIIIRPGS